MTSTALDLNHRQAATALAIQPGQIAWDSMQLAALDQLGLKDAGDGDRAVFLHQCQRTGLDPFARQIYMIPRPERVPGSQNQWRTRWTIQTGIDGWRVIRDRAERRQGVRGTLSRAIWYDHDGNEYKVWVRQDAPAACELTYTLKDRDGTETPYTSVLQFREYAQFKDGNLVAQWAVKKSHMLEKCTEADVYRKAFPQDFSGIDLDGAMPEPEAAAPPRGRVTAGEIIGRGEPAAREPAGDEAPAPPRKPQPASSGQLAMIGRTLAKLGVDDEERPGTLERLAGRDLAETGPLTQDEAARIRGLLDKCATRADIIELLATGELPETGQAGGDDD
jgi:hypothetical protein